MSSSNGMMTFPTEWKVIKHVPVTTKQLFYRTVPHRIHGAAIYGKKYHQYTPNVSIPYMDPMGTGLPTSKGNWLILVTSCDPYLRDDYKTGSIIGPVTIPGTLNCLPSQHQLGVPFLRHKWLISWFWTIDSEWLMEFPASQISGVYCLSVTMAFVCTIWLWRSQFAMERSTMLLIGKPPISGPCSMVMLNNQMVNIYIYTYIYIYIASLFHDILGLKLYVVNNYSSYKPSGLHKPIFDHTQVAADMFTIIIIPATRPFQP